MTNQTSSEQGVLLEMMTARDDAQRVAGRLTVELECAYMQIESQKVMQRGLEKQILNLREGLPELPEPMEHRMDAAGPKRGDDPARGIREMYGSGVPDLDDRPDEDISGQSSPDVDSPEHVLTQFKKVWDTLRGLRDKADAYARCVGEGQDLGERHDYRLRLLEAHERDTEAELKTLGQRLHVLGERTARVSGRLDDFCGGGGGVKQAVAVGISEVLGKEINTRLVSAQGRLEYKLRQWVLEQVKPAVQRKLEANVLDWMIGPVAIEVAKQLEVEVGKIKEHVTVAVDREAEKLLEVEVPKIKDLVTVAVKREVANQIAARDHAEVAAFGQDAADREAGSGEASNASEAPH